MRRIRAATILSSFRAAVDGGRATAAAFSTANPKPKPHTKPPSDIFGVFVRNQLKNEGRARKILFREYGGRATKDEDELADKKKVNTRKVPLSKEEFNAFAKNFWVECQTDYGMDHEKFNIVCREFDSLLKKDGVLDYESGDVTQNDRVDKLAEIAAEEELDALITNSFVTNLMIECEPKYEKRFREIIEKVRKKMIQDDDMLEAFQLITDLMSKCEPEYEKLICEVLEKVRGKITQDGGNENIISKIEKLAKLDVKVGDIFNFEEEPDIFNFEEELDKFNFEEELDKFVTRKFLQNLRSIEEKKSYFMAYEVIEKVAKKVGNENVCKIAEEKLDALVTDLFLWQTVGVRTNMTDFKLFETLKSLM